VLGCCVVLGVFCRDAAGAARPAADTAIDPLDLLPGKLQAVGHVDFEQLGQARLTAKFIGMLRKFAEQKVRYIEEFLSKGKVDPDNDLRSAALGLEDFGSDGRPNGVVVVTGDFNSGALYRAIEELHPWGKVKRSAYKGHSLLRGEDGTLLGVLAGKVCVVGSEESVKKVIDIYKGDAKGEAKTSPLMARLKDAADKTFWFVADLNIPARPEGADSETAMMPGLDLSKIKAVAASGKFTAEAFDLKAVFDCGAAGPANALMGSLSQDMSMFVAMSNMATSGDLEDAKTVNRLLEGIRIDSEGAAAVIEINITSELAEKLEPIVEKILQSRGPAGTMGRPGAGGMGPPGGGMMPTEGFGQE